MDLLLALFALLPWLANTPAQKPAGTASSPRVPR